MEEVKEESAFERMAKDIEKIRSALQSLDKLGISSELMTIYICHKTKMGRYKVNAVLDAQKEFLENAIKKK
jgi:hypothetical protein